jgi:hypothetical protein
MHLPSFLLTEFDGLVNKFLVCWEFGSGEAVRNELGDKGVEG